MTRSSSRHWWSLLFVLLAAALSVALLLPASSLAEQPFRLATQIEDVAGVLGAGTAEVEQAIQTLQDDENVQLWVTYVDTFSGLGAQDWADETAAESDLGLNDVLLAVAVGDRSYAYSVAQEFPLDQAQMDAVMTEDVEPALRDEDWPGAAVAATAGITAALHEADGHGGSGSSSGGEQHQRRGRRSRRRRPDRAGHLLGAAPASPASYRCRGGSRRGAAGVP